MILERVGSAVGEILLFGKLPHVPSVDVATALGAFVERGGRLRMLVEDGFLDDAVAAEEAEKYRALPAEIRRVSELPSKMILIDGLVAIASILQPGGRNLDLVLRHDGFVGHFVSSFEHRWVQGEPVDEAVGARPSTAS